MHIVLPGELVEEVDALAKRLKTEDPYSREVTRTDAIKILVVDGLRARRAK
jgi:hypothetical protein